MLRNRRSDWRLALAAWTGFAFAACGDSTGPAGVFDPEADAAAVSALESELAGNPALASMALVGQATGGSFAFVPLAFGSGSADPASTYESLRAQLSALGGGGFRLSAVIPSELRGRTYEYNPTTGQYEHNPARTGAPSNGVRLVLYAVNPVTYEPVEPLTEIGYVDLIDLSTSTTDRLRVVAVVEGVTYVDYTLSASASGSLVVLTAVGYVSNGTERVSFSFRVDFDMVAGVLSIDITLEAVNRGFRVDLSADMRFNGFTDEPESLTLVYVIRSERGAVRFAVTITDTSIEGDIRLNGRVIVLISGDETSVTFTRADGTELTPQELAALENLFDVPDSLLEFLEFLAAPLGIFSA